MNAMARLTNYIQMILIKITLIMADKTKFLYIIPVLPSSDILRDLAWYEKHAGFTCLFNQDNMYAAMVREQQGIHLQWHADNEDDPLLAVRSSRFL